MYNTEQVAELLNSSHCNTEFCIANHIREWGHGTSWEKVATACTICHYLFGVNSNILSVIQKGPKEAYSKRYSFIFVENFLV